MSEYDKIRQQLSAYLDGELSDADAAKVDAAVEADPALADELSQLETVRKLVKSLPRQEAGDVFVADVISRAERRDLIGSDEHAERPETNWVRYVASAAVILITVGLGTLFTHVLNRPGFIENIAENEAQPAGRIALDSDEYTEKKISMPGEAAGEAQADEAIAMEVTPSRGRGDRTAEVVADIKDEIVEVPPSPVLSPLEAGKISRNEEISVGTVVRTKVRGAADSSGEDYDSFRQVGVNASSVYKEPGGDKALGQSLPLIASSQPALAVELAFAEARREDIYTDDLPRTQKLVEAVLATNDVIPLKILPPANNLAMIASQQAIGQANYFQVIPATEKQVQYMAYVTTEQMARIRRSLSVVRMGNSADLEGLNVARLNELRQLRGEPASRQAKSIASVTITRERRYVAIKEDRRGRLSLAEDGPSTMVAKPVSPPAPPAKKPATRAERANAIAKLQMKPLVDDVDYYVEYDSNAPNQQAGKWQSWIAGRSVTDNQGTPLLISLNYREPAATPPVGSARPVPPPPAVSPSGPASLPSTMPN